MPPVVRTILSASTLTCLVSFAGQAAENAETGRQIAETWCRPCHAVGQRQTSDMAPPFAEIANSRTRDEIVAFLANPHGQMPNIQLARQQIVDIAAFMATLK